MTYKLDSISDEEAARQAAKPKGPNERAIDAMFRVCEGGVLTPRLAVTVIEAAGLQIIEKGQ